TSRSEDKQTHGGKMPKGNKPSTPPPPQTPPTPPGPPAGPRKALAAGRARPPAIPPRPQELARPPPQPPPPPPGPPAARGGGKGRPQGGRPKGKARGHGGQHRQRQAALDPRYEKIERQMKADLEKMLNALPGERRGAVRESIRGMDVVDATNLLKQ